MQCTRHKLDLRHLWLRGLPEIWPLPSEAPGTTPPSDSGSLPLSAPPSSIPGKICRPCHPCEPSPPVRRVAIAKHLCGCATDFALRSMVLAAGDGGNADSAVMRGVMIATCCHHKCTWNAYVNQPFMERLGFGAAEFTLLTLLSSWATVGGAAARTPADAVDAEASTGYDEHAAAAPEAQCLGERLSSHLDGPARRHLGRMCKRLLDTGRLLYLCEHGYDGRLQTYVPEEVSPENVLLVAEPKSNKSQ